MAYDDPVQVVQLLEARDDVPVDQDAADAGEVVGGPPRRPPPPLLAVIAIRASFLLRRARVRRQGHVPVVHVHDGAHVRSDPEPQEHDLALHARPYGRALPGRQEVHEAAAQGRVLRNVHQHGDALIEPRVADGVLVGQPHLQHGHVAVGLPLLGLGQLQVVVLLEPGPQALVGLQLAHRLGVALHLQGFLEPQDLRLQVADDGLAALLVLVGVGHDLLAGRRKPQRANVLVVV
mmetsp:Transcript_51423/g.144919  ORF Transcript_51423/g.144919 Transcript_51423/m.144919 type:complete len:234 (-) Transcript_51423:682-1383(-)